MAFFPGFLEPEIPGYDAGSARSRLSKHLIKKALFPKSPPISSPDAAFFREFSRRTGKLRTPATGKKGARRRPFRAAAGGGSGYSAAGRTCTELGP